ncbi:MAG: nicotinate-nucleotide--dimethylbenzimidazole phosphoribosyltransferase [Pseudomonadota bacterium]
MHDGGQRGGAGGAGALLPDHTVPAPPAGIETAIRAAWAQKTMPPGALGSLLDLAVALGRAQHSTAPAARPAEAILFAADHGILAEGVSAWPAAVTALMVETIAGGGAAASVLARAADARLTVVDMGVATPYRAPPPGLVDRAIRPGTRNAAIEDALTPPEVDAALAAGAEVADAALARGARVLALGEMGIGNTSAAALLAHAVAGLPLDTLAGPGAGLDAAGVAAKYAVLARAAARRPGPLAPHDALAAFGGLEIAALSGAMIAGAAGRAAVLVDGFIATAAALVALSARPEIRPALLFAHRSAEPGHAAMLAHLGAAPLLDLGLRLGEGTGALVALPLVDAAARLLGEMASFEEAGIAGPA